MKTIRQLTTALAAWLVACGGDVVVDQDQQGGGASSSSSGTGGAPAGPTSSSSSVGQGGTGNTGNTDDTTSVGAGPSQASSSSGPTECTSCGELISGEGSQEDLCPGSEELLAELGTCICAEFCAMQCASSVCSGMRGPTDDCLGCINMLCIEELEACFNDG